MRRYTYRVSLEADIYKRLPIPLQNLAISLKGFVFEKKRSNPERIRFYTNQLLESEKWSKEQFEAYQQEQLLKLLQHCFKNIPYYKNRASEFGIDPQNIKVEDFYKIPILTKEEVRTHQDELVDPSVPKDSLVKTSTSGSTGKALTIYQTSDSVSHRFAFVSRLRTWAGLSSSIYPKRAQFTGRDIVPSNQNPNVHNYWRANKPNNALLFSTVHLREETVPHYLKALREFDPELIDGYPSALQILARIGSKLGLQGPRPKAIIVSAETLTPEARQEMMDFYKCKVYDQYAGSEPSCLWMDCEHGNMHISPEYGISEVLREDGTPAGPGESGDIVLTSFINPVMPFLRYQIGDMAIVGPDEPCPCGRNMPRIASIEGRKDDILYIPEKGYVGRLDPVFKGLYGIVEAQIIQESLQKLTILLVPGQDYEPSIETKLIQQLREKVGEQVQIEYKIVEQVPRGPNGKFRSVITRCRDQYPTKL